MFIKFLGTIVLLSGLSLQAGYIGSYQVDQGPFWGTNPATYTPQEAAALLFGGLASDYWISTNPNIVDPNTITHTGWESIWGISGGTVFAENAKINTFYDCGFGNCAASAYVDDNAIGSQYTNYVWSADNVATPEPSTFSLTGSLLALGLAFMRPRKRSS